MTFGNLYLRNSWLKKVLVTKKTDCWTKIILDEMIIETWLLIDPSELKINKVYLLNCMSQLFAHTINAIYSHENETLSSTAIYSVNFQTRTLDIMAKPGGRSKKKPPRKLWRLSVQIS